MDHTAEPSRRPNRSLASRVTAVALSAITCAAFLSPFGNSVSAQELASLESRATATFELDWTRTFVAGSPVTTSSPVVVDNGGDPFIVVGDMGGNLGAFDLDTGTPVPGWSGRRSGFVVRAPLSTDGSNIYVPVSQDGKDRYPQYRKFSASGTEIWRSNHSTAIPSNPSTGFLLSGVSLARIGGAWTGFAGSSGHWIYGINASNGARLWSFRNADSTMATPAIADLYGTGTPQVITSNDTSREFPGDSHGGILRILTHDGRQICTATQLVSGDRYAASGYNNSSPVVADVGGRPLIAFGSTGPTQHGDGGNQVVAYDHACRLRWASPPLASQAAPSPSIADTRGTGGLQVIQVVGVPNGASTYPRVYVLDSTNGRIISDTGSRLKSYGASLAYPSSLSITTADLNGDGAQDLLVPARQGSFLLLNGPDLSVIGTMNTNMAIQNTPVVTSEPGGIRISMAGYNASGGVISSWVASGATLGARGWHTFGHDAQRTGLMGKLSGPYDQLVEGQSLRSGEIMRSLKDVYRMTMQTDGNLVIRRRTDGAVRWASGTRSPGSSLLLFPDGNLVIRASNGKWLWESRTRGAGTDRVQLSDDGTLRVYTSTLNGTRLLSSVWMLWRSDTGLVK